VELFSPAWFSALLAIILIDLVLAGDNAIVIALAARNLPPHLQKKAILWGTAGAIIVRSVMTVGVVWLLKIPGLMLVGGLGLVWIAYKLLVDFYGGKDVWSKGHTPHVVAHLATYAVAVIGVLAAGWWASRRAGAKPADTQDPGAA
jgi:predicted tellurium resistance membrane protein TerC